MRMLQQGVLTLGIVLGGAAFASPGYAQDFDVGPRGYQVERYERDFDRGPGWDNRGPGWENRGGRGAIGRWEAISAARGAGLVDIEEVSRRGPHWVIEGSDRRGRDLTVTIHGWNGRVLNVRRY